MNIIIEQSYKSRRVDIFLKEVLEKDGFSRGEIIRQIQSGAVLVNGRLVKPSYLLKVGDVVSIAIEKKERRLKANSAVELEIIFEDQNIIVINKPAGLQVHPSTQGEPDTLVNGLLFRYPEIATVHDDSSDAWSRPGIVHRLDKDTSGVMVVARTQTAFDELKRKFQDREIKKEYLAIVYGHIIPKRGIINQPIARSADYRKQVIAGSRTKTQVRQAVSEYEVLEERANYSVVAVVPRTGRMHQIRVHLSSIGCPLVGDKKYARKNISGSIKADRHLLHAKRLTFELFNDHHVFEVEPPEYFCQWMN